MSSFEGSNNIDAEKFKEAIFIPKPSTFLYAAAVLAHMFYIRSASNGKLMACVVN